MPQSKLADLIDLARQPSSVQRRTLLREITDVFFVAPSYSSGELAQFDAVLCALAAEMEEAVRAELAVRFSTNPAAPHSLIRTLANDAASVAEPVLLHSNVLTDKDLMEIVQNRGQDHLRAVSRRADLSEQISDVIVDRGDDATLNVLVNNETAVLSRQASETLVERSADNPGLHAALVGRKSLPADLLNAMYFDVEAKLRDKILERNREMDPAELKAALELSRKRLALRDGVLPPDYAEAEAFVQDLRARNAMTPQSLARMLREGRRTHFLLALSESTGVAYTIAARIVERRDLDALAILCKAADFDRALFMTFAVLIAPPEEAMGRAAEYGALYGALPKETALRTLRFWRMRQESAYAPA
jgi:uncharacterized protein (DUF2336 family)